MTSPWYAKALQARWHLKSVGLESKFCLSQARIAACHLAHESVDGSNGQTLMLQAVNGSCFFPTFFWLGAGGEWCLSANLFLALSTQFSGSLGSSQVQNARESNLHLKDKYKSNLLS